jgi:iron complex transport system ATP-binding protein
MSRLSINEVDAGYGREPFLRGISLSVEPGEVLALIGPNGSGKTTLIRAICRILKPLAGTVTLDGRNIWDLSVRAAARRIARVPQTGNTAWPFTIHQIVTLGRFPHRGWLGSYTGEDERITNEALAITGLWDLRHRVVTTLSGGEQQRAMIARALAQTPDILVLDEPVAHLDLKYQVSVLDLLRTLAGQGLTVVVSLHDLNHAALYADRIALLQAGRLRGLGRPEEILRRETIEEVYETPVLVSRHPDRDLPLVTPIPRAIEKAAGT